MYKFSLSQFNVDPTRIEQIEITVYGLPGTTVTLEEIETSSGSTVTMIYNPWVPRIITALCGPRGGAQTIGWDWAVDWPSQPQLAGPQLQVQGISGPGCAGVELEAQSSGEGFGEVGLVTVDWLGQFDGGMFELAFVTDPDANYVATLEGEPVLDHFENGFRLTYGMHVSDAFDIPSGIIRQELIVAPGPNQQIWLDYAEAFPNFDGGVGYTLSFGYSGSLFDPSQPLLEIYTSGAFGTTRGRRPLPWRRSGTSRRGSARCRASRGAERGSSWPTRGRLPPRWTSTTSRAGSYGGSRRGRARPRGTRRTRPAPGCRPACTSGGPRAGRRPRGWSSSADPGGGAGPCGGPALRPARNRTKILTLESGFVEGARTHRSEEGRPCRPTPGPTRSTREGPAPGSC